MIEAYAFFVAFTVQILALSVLHPARFIRHVRAHAMSFPAERFEQLYPGVELSVSLERFATLYRVLNIAIALLGLSLLGWLSRYMRRPGWDDGPVETLVSLYFAAQIMPLGLVVGVGLRYRKMLEHVLAEGKRKAVLQRRGLFDFVSPFIVSIAVASYFLFAGFVIYIEQRPFAGFAGSITNIGGLTLVYALNAFCVYTMLYGRKNPLQSHADRVRAIGVGVRACVHSSIACVVFLSLNFTLALLGLQRWEPFALCVFFITCAVLCFFMGFGAPTRQPKEGGLGPISRSGGAPVSVE